MPPPQIPLVNRDGTPLNVNSLPSTGVKTASESLPVTLSQGVSPVQRYLDIPIYDSTKSTTIVNIVAVNPLRRYLKIVNNGPVPIELWTTDKPQANQVGQTISRGEFVPPGGGLLEAGERISAIYATSFTGASGVLVLEG